MARRRDRREAVTPGELDHRAAQLAELGARLGDAAADAGRDLELGLEQLDAHAIAEQRLASLRNAGSARAASAQVSRSTRKYSSSMPRVREGRLKGMIALAQRTCGLRPVFDRPNSNTAGGATVPPLGA